MGGIVRQCIVAGMMQDTGCSGCMIKCCKMGWNEGGIKACSSMRTDWQKVRKLHEVVVGLPCKLEEEVGEMVLV